VIDAVSAQGFAEQGFAGDGKQPPLVPRCGSFPRLKRGVRCSGNAYILITDGRANVSFTIPDALLQSARISEAELRQEIAVLLFQRDKLTLAQASRFAPLSRLQFQHLLASRQIPVHYDVTDFEEDLDTLHRLGRL